MGFQYVLLDAKNVQYWTKVSYIYIKAFSSGQYHECAVLLNRFGADFSLRLMNI